MTRGFYVLAFGLSLFALPVSAEETAWAEVTPELGAIGETPSGYQKPTALTRLNEIGRALFAAPFTAEDGAGRPRATQAILPTKTRRPLQQDFARLSGPDAAACGSCHNQPALGGAGDFVTNVFVSEGFNNHDFNTVDLEFSNERGTNHLFGAGLIELLAREMTADLQAIRKEALAQAAQTSADTTLPLTTKGVEFGSITAGPDGLLDVSGVDGVDIDLVIRPFSQKGVFTSLRQFTVNAMNHHHGMQAGERFGARWTGEDDFDEDGYAREMNAGDISALVAWQAMLEPPVVKVPEVDGWAEAAAAGKEQFQDIGCASCHRLSLPLKSLAFHDPGPLDAAGTLSNRDVDETAMYNLAETDWALRLETNYNGEFLIPLFGDLKRHKIADGEIDRLGNELFSQRFVARDEFLTAELWGVGSTPPYGHRNDITTLRQIILAHGGEARASRDAFDALAEDAKGQIIAFLKTLHISENAK